VFRTKYTRNYRTRFSFIIFSVFPSLVPIKNIIAAGFGNATQFLTGHGDFIGELTSFDQAGSGQCRRSEERETVGRMLFKCTLLGDDRDRLRATACPNGEGSGRAAGARIRGDKNKVSGSEKIRKGSN